MSEQIKIDIFSALKSNSVLASIVSTRIHTGWAPTNATFPCVAFWQAPGGSADLADGEFAIFDDVYAVDCFAKTMTENEKMLKQVDKVFSSLPYVVRRELNYDLYEQDTLTHHKVLRYRVKS